MTRSTRPGCLAVRYPAKLRAFVEMTTCSIFIDNTNPVVNPGHTGSSKDVGGACPLRRMASCLEANCYTELRAMH